MGHWIENTEQKKRDRRRNLVGVTFIAFIIAAILGANVFAVYVALHREYGFEGGGR